MKTTFFQFVRYNLVGVINTLIGFSIIFSLMYFGLSPMISNFIGYSIGAIFSFYLNKKYTFKDTQNSKKQMIHFFTVLSIAYVLNFITLQILLETINPYLAQLFSGAVYTLSSFILAKLFVFKGSQ